MWLVRTKGCHSTVDNVGWRTKGKCTLPDVTARMALTHPAKWTIFTFPCQESNSLVAT